MLFLTGLINKPVQDRVVLIKRLRSIGLGCYIHDEFYYACRMQMT